MQARARAADHNRAWQLRTALIGTLAAWATKASKNLELVRSRASWLDGEALHLARLSNERAYIRRGVVADFR